MDAIKPTRPGVPVPCLSDGPTALNIVVTHKQLVLHGGLHPQVDQGVVEQQGEGGLQTQWVNIQGIVARNLFHDDDFL